MNERKETALTEEQKERIVTTVLSKGLSGLKALEYAELLANAQLLKNMEVLK